MDSPLVIDRLPAQNAIERRYGAAAATEWQLVLSHFELADGFALLILVVPDRDGSEICRKEIRGYVEGKGKRLVCVEPESPADLRRLAAVLFDQPCGEDIGAIWVSAVVPRSA